MVSPTSKTPALEIRGLQAWYGESHVLHMPQDALAIKAQLGVVSQFDTLDPDFSCAENLLVYGRYFGLKDAVIRERIDPLLEFGALSHKAKAKPGELSGGMKKRIGLARAVITNPEVILYDEPTAGLDPINTRRIADLILLLEDHLKCTSLVVTHDMQVVESISNEVAFFYKGRVRQMGAFKELENSEDNIVSGFIKGDASLLLTAFGSM